MTRILITGGAGFIGSALVPELLSRGADVAVVDNLSFGRREFVPLDDKRFFKVDIRDHGALRSVLTTFRPEWIVHLAAIHFIPYCNQHPFEAADVNILGTRTLLRAASKIEELEGFLFASTAAVYPIHDGPCAEDLEPGPLDIYGVSKLAGEHLCREFYLDRKVPMVLCRFFNAFGPNETNPHLIPEIQKQVNAGARTLALGNLEPKRDFIHTSDMARAVRMLIERHDSGLQVLNLGRGIEYSVQEIVDAFARQLGTKLRVEQDPHRVRKSDRNHLLADISRLGHYTGWKPQIDLDQGIATLVERPA